MTNHADTTIYELQQAVQAMLEGEPKRREKALRFLDALTAVLVPVAQDAWGNDSLYGHGAVVKIADPDNCETPAVYFRGTEWVFAATGRTEPVGFYADYAREGICGSSIKDLRGPMFWLAMRLVIDGLSNLTESLRKRSEGRDELAATAEKIAAALE